MQWSPWRDLRAEVIPGAAIALLGLVSWFALRGNASAPQQFFTGWLLLLLVFATGAMIVRAAAGHRAWQRLLAAWILALAVITLLIALAGVGGHFIGVAQCSALVAVFASWLALWTSLTWLFRRRGPAVGSSLALAKSMFLMASPIALMPLLHATHGSPIVVQFIRHACPFFALLDAIRPTINFDWSHLPGMYAWSGLGQDVPMLLPNAWLCSTIYALAALTLCALHRLRVLCAEKAPQPRAKSPI